MSAFLVRGHAESIVESLCQDKIGAVIARRSASGKTVGLTFAGLDSLVTRLATQPRMAGDEDIHLDSQAMITHSRAEHPFLHA
jgi:hypothetical protein